MTKLKWLVSLAQGKPLIFVIAILLVAMGYTYPRQQERIENFEITIQRLNTECNQRTDSLTRAFAAEREKLNAETKATLNDMVEDYKRQLQDQRSLNRKVDETLLSNQRILKQKEEQLKSLNNDN